MGKTLSQRATEAAREVQADPVRFVDRVFFVFGTLASAWLAFLLIHKALTAGWRELWYLIPFWLTVTYLLLPRIHTVLSRIYLPDYFIGRTRTREGVLGDPVNVALRGDANQIHTAMVNAGWKLADELDIRTGFRIVTHTLGQKTYPDAPVSSLYLFGRRHAFTYQQEVEGNPRKRHHVRFWPTPQGWLLP
ncbi:MAG TPA: LssY C-terminal domain-containing protein, partial [Beutenbergiaceae bacterium]|nr:LssY C-terminal domain-containing protein [Beutenbergiaceae bacterium]